MPDVGIYQDQDWSESSKAYAAMVTRMDADIGRLFQSLKELGLDDQTLVLFSSDNGPQQEGVNDPAFFGSSGPLRGIKRDLYEGGIRAPFLARWPGRIQPGRVSDQMAYFGDFLATAAEKIEAILQTVRTDSVDWPIRDTPPKRAGAKKNKQ